MLTELTAKNFKSWRSIDQMRLAPITGLFGTNSSGKSSILQLLLMLRQTVESSDRAAVLEFGSERSLTQLGSFQDVIFGHKTDQLLDIQLCWELPDLLNIKDPTEEKKLLITGKNICFATTIRNSIKDRLFVEKLSYRLADYQFVMAKKDVSGSKYDLHTLQGEFSFKRSKGRVWDLPSPTKCYGFPDQTFAYFQNASFLSDLQLKFEELFKTIYYLGPLRDFPQRHYVWSGSGPADVGQRGERSVDAVLASRDSGKYISTGYRRRKQTLEERVAHWLKELGLISSFAVNSIGSGSIFEVRVKKTPSSSEVLITDVGFGVSQVLPVLVLCYYVPEGSTILLEQPEIHLHPSVQSGLADVLIDVAQNRHLQIIVESHSEHLLRRLQRRVAENSLEAENVAIYFCDVVDGTSALSNLEMNSFGSISNWPKDFFGDEFGEMAAITEAAMKRKINHQEANSE